MNAGALRLALIGDPVEHSVSPVLQRAFMDRERIVGSYERITVPAREGKNAIVALRERGFCGLNVTTPLKEEAYFACDRKSQIVLAVGAVNTVVFDIDEPSGGPFGTNTDGAGAIAAVRFAASAEPRDAGTILVLGAGPTARAGLYALAAAGAAVRVWNRTESRARDVAARFEVRVWAGQPVDVVLSTLPPGAEIEEPLRAALLAARVVIDANYGPRATLGSRLGRDVCDGLSMLSGSARASFDVWLAAHHKSHKR
ncbi:MAG: hypothetical protein GIW95_01005 [Candidatus Eremiobacteraeota bacterium]|nr:hypothetical protein [Candidatus Eremiobacteraeota bacterium]